MPVVAGSYFAEAAYSYNGQGLTYANYDCTHFTNLVRRTCGLSNLSQGSNAMWRSSAMLWKGSIQEAYTRFNGTLPQGLYLFHSVPDDDPEADPDHYGYGDGIGDVNHVGIYTGLGLGVMQSGGYDGTGVHDSRLRSYFNKAACPTGIDYTGRIMPTLANPTIYRSFYVSPDDYLGTRDAEEAEVTDMQKQNANAVKSYFIGQGWTLQAVCGLLGNMQYDSGINPAFIQVNNRYRLNDNAQDLTVLPSYYMQYFFGEHYNDTDTSKYGLGLLQNTTRSRVNYLYQHYIVAHGIVEHSLWFDGWAQMKRLTRERNSDMQGPLYYFDTVTVNGNTYTFTSYARSTNNVRELAEAWARGYDRNVTGLSSRQDNASYWYNYFTGPDAPDPIPEPAPEPYVINGIPAWFYPTIFSKRKEYKKTCKTI